MHIALVPFPVPLLTALHPQLPHQPRRRAVAGPQLQGRSLLPQRCPFPLIALLTFAIYLSLSWTFALQLPIQSTF